MTPGALWCPRMTPRAPRGPEVAPEVPMTHGRAPGSRGNGHWVLLRQIRAISSGMPWASFIPRGQDYVLWSPGPAPELCARRRPNRRPLTSADLAGFGTQGYPLCVFFDFWSGSRKCADSHQIRHTGGRGAPGLEKVHLGGQSPLISAGMPPTIWKWWGLGGAGGTQAPSGDST